MKKLILSIIVCVAFLIINYSQLSYFECTPLVLGNDEIIEKPSLLTENHKFNMIQVLNYYNEKWKLEDGKLFVKRNIDRELLWNYTSKANDSIWLSTHKSK